MCSHKPVCIYRDKCEFLNLNQYPGNKSSKNSRESEAFLDNF